MPKAATISRPASNSATARARREQIVAAAVDIITAHGLHHLSLSKIEARAKMKRGQLTYYFPTKEAILLAVFDRMVLLLYQQINANIPAHHQAETASVWDCVQQMLQTALGPKPLSPEFHALQHTFLAQIAHRHDFRDKLAILYEEWRTGLAEHWQQSAKPRKSLAKNLTGRTVSSFLQALMHGLTMQLAADPNAFDRSEMLRLCIGVLAPLFAHRVPKPRTGER